MKRIYWLLFPLGVWACSQRVLPVVTQVEAVYLQTCDKAFPDSNRIAKGRELYLKKCGKCHYLYLPSEYPVSEWYEQVGEMATRSHLSAKDSAFILMYLRAVIALDSLMIDAADTPAGQGAD